MKNINAREIMTLKKFSPTEYHCIKEALTPFPTDALLYITFNILEQNTRTKWVKVINMVFRNQNQNYFLHYKFIIPFKESHKQTDLYIYSEEKTTT